MSVVPFGRLPSRPESVDGRDVVVQLGERIMLRWPREEAEAVVARVRQAGGTAEIAGDPTVFSASRWLTELG